MTKSIVLKGNGKPTIIVTRSSEGSEESSLFEDAFLNQGFKLGKTTTDADIHSNSYLAKPSPQTKMVVAEELLKLTFAIQYNPNCPSQWLVRLPGKSGSIDMKPYRDLIGIVPHQTGDVLGFGKTLEEAARAALTTEGQP